MLYLKIRRLIRDEPQLRGNTKLLKVNRLIRSIGAIRTSITELISLLFYKWDMEHEMAVMLRVSII